MTEQEIYDTIITHLRKQGHKSLLETPIKRYGGKLVITCAYHGKDGDKCAAGILIADSDYTEKMEGTGWGDVVRWLSNASELREHNDLIVQLQGVHDSDGVEHWEARFSEIARYHQLTYTPPQLMGE